MGWLQRRLRGPFRDALVLPYPCAQTRTEGGRRSPPAGGSPLSAHAALRRDAPTAAEGGPVVREAWRPFLRRWPPGQPGGQLARPGGWRPPYGGRVPGASPPARRACAERGAPRGLRGGGRPAPPDWRASERAGQNAGRLPQSRQRLTHPAANNGSRAQPPRPPRRQQRLRSTATPTSPPPTTAPGQAYPYPSGSGRGAGGPIYSALGRISRLFAACSAMAAVQPTVREQAKVGVNMSRGMPAEFMTTPA